jgi:glucose-1-phosphate thymidylyltransferase
MTCFYLYDNRVIEYVKYIKLSARGEIEIVDLNRLFLGDASLNVEFMGQGLTWLDTAKHEFLIDAINFVKTIETHKHRKIAYLDEIAYLNGWIRKEDVLMVCEAMKKNQ